MRRALRGVSGVGLVVTGMGQAAARRAAEQWVPQAGAVVVCGVAGGLDSSVAAGEVVMASRVVDGEGRDVGPVVTAELRGVGCVAVASVDAVADGATDRAALRDVGAHVVETEAAAWVAACAQRGVPVAVVRAVLDTPEQPLGIAAGMLGAGETGPGAGAVMAASLRPSHWLALLRLGRRVALCERRAAAAAVVLSETLR